MPWGTGGTPVILATWEAEIGRIRVSRPFWANSSQDLISKIARAKWTGGVAQVAELLFHKTKAEFKPQSQQKQTNKKKISTCQKNQNQQKSEDNTLKYYCVTNKSYDLSL
jgi:hypothetical protein